MGSGKVLKYNDEIREARIKIGVWIAFFSLVVHFFFTSPVYSQKRQFSPEFISLMTQVQQIYLAPRGATIGMLEDQAPASLATLIGHALRQQWPYVQQNSSLQNRFVNLQYEVQGYLGEVAKITRDPGPGGQGVTGDILWNFTSRAMQGYDDGWALQNYGVQSGMMPSIFAAGPGTQPPPQSFAKPPGYDEPEPQKPGGKLDLLGVSPQNVPQGSIPPYPWDTKPPKDRQESSPPGVKGEPKACKFWVSPYGWKSVVYDLCYVKGQTPTLGGDCKKKGECLCCDKKNWGDVMWREETGINCVCVSSDWLNSLGFRGLNRDQPCVWEK